MQNFPWQGGGGDAFTCGNPPLAPLIFYLMVSRFWTIFFGLILALGLRLEAAAPGNCTAVTSKLTSSNASITISWIDNSMNEIGWQLYFNDNGGNTFSPLGGVTTTTNQSGTGGTVSIPWNFAQLNKLYQFIVIAVNASGPNQSNIATVKTDDLSAPINFSVTAVDPFNVRMFWEEQSTTENGFSIERKIGSGAWQILTPANGANVLGIGASQLTAPSQSYSFRVRAFKGSAPTTPDSSAGTSGVSAYSSEVTMTAAAYTITATAVPGQTRINLSWPNIANETGYVIYALLPGGFFYEQTGLIAANTTTTQVTNPLIEAAKTYSFIVSPYIGINTIGESNSATVTVDGMTSKTGASSTPGATFSHTFTHASSATVTSRSLTGVPSGLAFNASTGTLTGVYPALGNYSLTYTLNLSNGAVLTQAFSIRVRPPAGAPLIGTTIPAWNGAAGTSRNTSLTGTFTDPEAESAVRVSTTLGTMDFILFNTATPATVTNFMSYVNAGKYTDVSFHRSIPSFVIQAGGFKGTGTGSNFTSVVTTPPVVNEPGISNLRGTISMAKLGGDPNSATSQFFVSTNDNSANLDFQNNGFTVFGRVAGNGMTVADAINSLPHATYNLSVNGGAATAFSDFPMNAATAPVAMDQTKVVKINSVTSIPTLSYSITGNTNPAVATASIVNGELQITGLSGGQTTITVTATDLDNLTTSQNVAVNLTDTFATWAARTSFPNGQNGATQNPDGDTLNNLLEYAFLQNPALPNTTIVPTTGSTAISPTTRAMTLQFPVRKFTTGMTYSVQANNQLTGTWTEIWNSSQGFAHAQVLSAVDQSDRTVVTIKDNVVIGAFPKRFLQVKVLQN